MGLLFKGNFVFFDAISYKVNYITLIFQGFSLSAL